MNHLILAINGSVPDAKRFFDHKIEQLGAPYTEALGIAVYGMRGYRPTRPHDPNFITVSQRQFEQALCPETVCFVKMRDSIEVEPLAYMDLDEFHGIATELLDSYADDLEVGNDYLFCFELAERIKPKFQLI